MLPWLLLALWKRKAMVLAPAARSTEPTLIHAMKRRSGLLSVAMFSTSVVVGEVDGFPRAAVELVVEQGRADGVGAEPEGVGAGVRGVELVVRVAFVRGEIGEEVAAGEERLVDRAGVPRVRRDVGVGGGFALEPDVFGVEGREEQGAEGEEEAHGEI